MILSAHGFGLRGLGADCPSWAPYASANGGCSNVPPELASVDISSFEDRGYSFQNGVAVAQPVEAAGDSGAYGYAPAGGYGVSLPAAMLEASRAEADADARRAEERGRQLGLNVACTTYQNTSPGSPSLFGTDCTVNGQPGHDADLLMLPGGFNIAATSAQYAAGNPVQHLALSTQAAPQYDYINPGVPDTLSDIRAVPSSGANVLTLSPPPAPPAGPRTQAAAGAATIERAVSGTSVQTNTTQNLIDRARAAAEPVLGQASASTGLSSTTLLLIAGAAALFLFTRGK